MIFRIPELTEDDERVIAEVADMHGGFRQRLAAEPKQRTGQLRRALTAAAIRGSLRIGGHQVPAEAIETLLTGGDLPASVDERLAQVVTGYRDALGYVQHSPAFSVFSWDHTLLSVLHYLMTRSDPDGEPGRYRQAPVPASGPAAYLGPEPEQVAGLVAELLTWLAQGDLDAPGLVRASVAQLNLASIHPWCQGSGRMSRLLHTLVLARTGELAPELCSIEGWLGSDDRTMGQYSARLSQVRGDRWEPSRDSHGWVWFCLAGHHLQAQLVQRRFDAAGRIWNRIADLAVRHKLPDRTVTAMYAAAMGQLRRPTYRADEGITVKQATADLADLRRLGLIQGVGHARSAHYIGSGPLREIRSDVFRGLRREPYTQPYRKKDDG